MSAKSLRLSDEDAYQIAADLMERSVEELSGVDIFTGVHSEHGPICVVIPLAGESILLFPFVCQD